MSDRGSLLPTDFISRPCADLDSVRARTPPMPPYQAATADYVAKLELG